MPHPPSPPPVDLVYTKTAAGRHEVGHRGAGLTARQRTALIMLDGQRDATALAGVMPAGAVAAVLTTLLGLGLIAAPAADMAPTPPPESSALAAIKAELIAAAQAYLGMMASDIVARVRQASDAAQLLRILGHWHMAMQDSKHGRDAASTLLEKTKRTLQGAAV
jgi:hypothetical protein